RKWRIIAKVEAATLPDTRNCGAPSPLGGISSAASQQASAKPITSSANGRALDQRVGGRQFLARQMIGQDAVFERPEQRRQHAEAGERREQNRQRGARIADDGDGGDEDLGELQPLRHARLVVAVGEFAAERRQEKERRDEYRARQRDQRLGVGTPAEQDEKDQRGFEKIIVECREELAGKQRRKAPR